MSDFTITVREVEMTGKNTWSERKGKTGISVVELKTMANKSGRGRKMAQRALTELGKRPGAEILVSKDTIELFDPGVPTTQIVQFKLHEKIKTPKVEFDPNQI